jgi:putative ABC transport system permease protein
MMSFFGGGGSSTNSNMYNISSSALGLQQTPTSVHIYPTNFSYKDKVTSYLDKWNEEETVTVNDFNSFYEATGVTREVTPDTENNGEVQYTDSVGLIISLINTMINIITYALIAFTALSLVVSCVMIALITYVSVMERVKEIGVIRSLGGRKKDVSHLFNAEAFIIGAISGIFGILITYIIQIVANILIVIISHGVVTKIANLTPLTAIIMILVSILLTSISGLLPAKSAARKDPVVALRTE